MVSKPLKELSFKNQILPLKLFSPTVTVTRSEMSAKTTYQRSAKGPVSITECSPDGKYIVLENTNKSKVIKAEIALR